MNSRLESDFQMDSIKTAWVSKQTTNGFTDVYISHPLSSVHQLSRCC